MDINTYENEHKPSLFSDISLQISNEDSFIAMNDDLLSKRWEITISSIERHGTVLPQE